MRGGDMRNTGYRVLFWGAGNETRPRWWLHNTVNVLNVTDLFTLK